MTFNGSELKYFKNQSDKDKSFKNIVPLHEMIDIKRVQDVSVYLFFFWWKFSPSLNVIVCYNSSVSYFGNHSLDSNTNIFLFRMRSRIGLISLSLIECFSSIRHRLTTVKLGLMSCMLLSRNLNLKSTSLKREETCTTLINRAFFSSKDTELWIRVSGKDMLPSRNQSLPTMRQKRYCCFCSVYIEFVFVWNWCVTFVGF